MAEQLADNWSSKRCHQQRIEDRSATAMYKTSYLKDDALGDNWKDFLF